MIRFWRRTMAVLLVTCFVSSLIWYGASASDAQRHSSASSHPPAGTLRIAMPDATPAVDPALVADEQNAELAGLLYSGLVRLDAHYNVVPAAATRWTVSPDRQTYTFHIRRGLRFTNGDPLTAYDFAYSITRSLNPALKSPSAPTYLIDIKGASAFLTGKAKSVTGVRVLDAYTLQLIARWPVPYFLMELTYPTSFALDKRLISKLGSVADSSWYSNPVGSGPYQLKSWSPNSQIVLAPNKYYPGQRALKKIVISLSPLPSSDLYQYVSHNLDVVGLPTGDPALVHQNGVHETKMLAEDGIYMNLHSKIFGNVHLRRALTMSLDRSSLVATALAGSASPFGGFVPPGENGYYPQLKLLPYNPSLARRELRAAGYSSPKKFPATILYCADDPDIVKLAQGLVSSWSKNLRISIIVKPLTLNTLLAKVQSNSLPLYLGGWSADYPDPHDWLSLQWRSDALNNNVRYASVQFDRLVETADVTWDPTQREHLYDQAQQSLVNDAAEIPLYIPHRLVFIRPGVTNLVLTGYGVIPRGGSWAGVGIESPPTQPHHHN